VNVSVSIKNNSSYTTFTGRTITLVVKDALGTPIGSAITETLPTIVPLATPTYTFTQSYTVPNVSAYSLLVYLDNADINSLNDTVSANRTAIDIGKDLQLVSLTYPSAITDTIGNPVNVSVSIQNNSSYTSFTGRTITLVVKDSQGTPIGSSIIETLPTINTLATPTYTFTQVYTVPNDLSYSLLVYIDSADINSVNDTISANRTTTDIGKDLQLISIINSFYGVVDTIGSVVDVMATVGNISRFTTFTGVNITVVVKSSQGQQLDAFTETIPSIGISDTVTYPFTQSYTIPNDSVYYLTVYIDSYDNDSGNDTINILRQTTSGRVGIFSMEGIKGFSLAQNIPNPVSGRSTRIDYSVPEAGDVMFHVHSISGQLLYSKTIKASCGANSIELNASTFATGIYVYSMEYKGQILVKQLIINSTN
jgi:hypothetical protein